MFKINDLVKVKPGVEDPDTGKCDNEFRRE